MRHPTTHSWRFPDADRAALPIGRRTNLRELAARPGRFEHHLMVVARAGDAQIELATASEPLYFAHQNISDEYALGLPTGDPLIDGFPVLTFLSAPDSHVDLARIRHRPGELVLHPHGLLHWTGRLRPPYQLPPFPGPRRTGLSLVCCASQPCPPASRPLGLSPGADVKAYADQEIPFMVADVMRESPRTLAVVGNARADLVVAPEAVGGPQGGYFLVIEAGVPGWCACDFIHLAPGEQLACPGPVRGLWIHAGVAAEPPPASWHAVPAAPWPPFEPAQALPLPARIAGIGVEAVDDATARITIAAQQAEIPRHWLARMLFRLGLHDFRLGYLETYGGFCYDDRDGFRLGLRGGAEVRFDDRAAIARAVEQLYRAVAPPGYAEDLR